MRSLTQYAKIGLASLALGLSMYCGGSSGGGSGGGNGGTKNHAPVVTIQSPSNGSSYFRGESIDLEATAVDPENDPISLSGWDLGGLTNNIVGLEGRVNAPIDSGLGNYVFTAHATDKKGHTGEADVTVNVLNNPPVADAGTDQGVGIGDPTYLDGSNSYDIDGNLTKCEWDIDGDGLYDWSSTR